MTSLGHHQAKSLTSSLCNQHFSSQKLLKSYLISQSSSCRYALLHSNFAPVLLHTIGYQCTLLVLLISSVLVFICQYYYTTVVYQCTLSTLHYYWLLVFVCQYYYCTTPVYQCFISIGYWVIIDYWCVRSSWVCMLRQFTVLWAMMTMGTAPIEVLLHYYYYYYHYYYYYQQCARLHWSVLLRKSWLAESFVSIIYIIIGHHQCTCFRRSVLLLLHNFWLPVCVVSVIVTPLVTSACHWHCQPVLLHTNWSPVYFVSVRIA